MAYNQYSLDALSLKIASLFDDLSELYWTRTEKYYAIWEALRVWGALTSHWRTRGTFNLDPTAATPYYDLSVIFPLLRSRSWTLDRLVRDIQYMMLEAAAGISGTGMSGQVSIASILDALRRARNRFVLDARLPATVDSVFASPAPPDGLVTYDQSSIYIHRTGWQDSYSGVWRTLWRQDAWERDHGDPTWTLSPGMPRAFSESECSPLKLQLWPPPLNPGILEAVEVSSLLINTADPNATFAIPDEWVHAVKYQALEDMLSAESQNKDPMRAQYAALRYKQAVDRATMVRSILRVMLNGVPLPLDSLAALDAAKPYWRNQVGRPSMVAVIGDLLVFDCTPDQAYGITVDVVQTAPLPVAGTDFLQIGAEDIPNIVDYATHLLTFKCGGKEFESTFPQYDAFLSAAADRAGINRTQMRYLAATMGQPEKEQAERPVYTGARRA